jgi:hypothetical protein
MHHITGRLELDLLQQFMETNNYTTIKSEDNTSWYTEEFISKSIEDYFKENGFKVHKETQAVVADRIETVIIASRYFTKEIIGVKGLQTKNDRSSLLKVMDKSASSHHAKSWFSESLFNSLVNFGKYYSDESAVVAMALPNVDRYKAIISKVADYFTSNNLSFKIYLVSENGKVEVSNLNLKF